MSAQSYAFSPARPTDRSRIAFDNGPMTNCPWVDAREVDELVTRYPSVPRSRIESVIEACWPMKNEVETILAVIANASQPDAA
jgi:hypothetical protein